MRTRRPRPAPVPRSAFAGFGFPPDVIVVAVRWSLRFGLSYRDVEELLAERGVQVGHATVHRWVQRFTPLLADAAKPCRHIVGDRWQVDEPDVKVAGQWRHVYPAIGQAGQVIDVVVAPRRDAKAARQFFERAIGATTVAAVEVTTDQAPVDPGVLEELLPAAWHRTEQYGDNRVGCDHGRLQAQLEPMRGLKRDRSARVIIAGHAFVRSVRRGQSELAAEEPATRRLARRSTNWPWPSDPGGGRGLQHAPGRRNATAPLMVTVRLEVSVVTKEDAVSDTQAQVAVVTARAAALAVPVGYANAATQLTGIHTNDPKRSQRGSLPTRSTARAARPSCASMRPAVPPRRTRDRLRPAGTLLASGSHALGLPTPTAPTPLMP